MNKLLSEAIDKAILNLYKHKERIIKEKLLEHGVNLNWEQEKDINYQKNTPIYYIFKVGYLSYYYYRHLTK